MILLTKFVLTARIALLVCFVITGIYQLDCDISHFNLYAFLVSVFWSQLFKGKNHHPIDNFLGFGRSYTMNAD